MKVRGTRECKDCGNRWAYYETGSVTCPDCGSLRSVGVDDRTLHTDDADPLDLSPHRSALGDGDLTDTAAVGDLKRTLREYLRRRGFVDAGRLRPLDDTYLAASELVHAVDVLARRRDPEDDEEWYVLELLRGADRGDRPAAASVPTAMAEARGLGVAESVEAYRSDLRTWLRDHPDPEARLTLGSLKDQEKRILALEGDVDPAMAEAVVEATRELGVYVAEDDEGALARARDRLARLTR